MFAPEKVIRNTSSIRVIDDLYALSNLLINLSENSSNFIQYFAQVTAQSLRWDIADFTYMISSGEKNKKIRKMQKKIYDKLIKLKDDLN